MPLIRSEEGERKTLRQASKLMLVSARMRARKGKTSTLTGGDAPRKLPFSSLDKEEVKKQPFHKFEIKIFIDM